MSNFTDLQKMAVYASHYSPDQSSQNAACLRSRQGDLILATLSVNEFPLNVKETPERWQRPTKYQFVEHAERNAIYAAAENGIKTDGLTMVALWAACADCARGIIQAGIETLVTLAPSDEGEHAAWKDSIAVAMEMFAEAYVDVVFVKGPLGVEVLRNGNTVLL